MFGTSVCPFACGRSSVARSILLLFRQVGRLRSITLLILWHFGMESVPDPLYGQSR